MTEDELLNAVRRILASYTEIPADKIKPAVALSDLGIDSLTAVGVVADLENALSVTIPNDEALEVRTVGDVLDRLRHHLGGGTQGRPVPA
jgi:acyl carrier protein